MLSLLKRPRKTKARNIYGASDQKVTRFFIWNRAWIANERIVGLTALIVIGLGVIGYATFALSLNSPAGYIDYPAPGQTISGASQYIAGWAVAASPVNHVDIVVNGVPARASYGTGAARPDVCANYPQSPNCAGSAQVGWQYYFNSTAMPNGTYSLYAVIYGNSGGVTQTPTQTFTVANSAPFGYIDSPAPGATVGNNITPGTTVINVGGWALDNETPISSVVMSIEGYTRVYYPTYGGDRPDVCAAYPGRPGCNAVGFNYPFDTSNVSNGSHTMYIAIYDSDGIQRNATMSRSFTVSNNSTPPNPTNPPTNPGGGGGTTAPPSPITGGNGLLDGFIDDPKPASQSPPNPYSGHFMTIDGWAIGLKSISNNIKVYIDGTFIGANAQYANGGTTRADVCVTHAGWVNCPAGNIGWQISYDTTKLANGTHTMKAVISDGAFPSHDYTTPSVSFVTKNAAPPPPSGTGLPPVTPPGGGTTPPANTNLKPDLFIDGINDPGTVATSASGWAIDNMTKSESAITKVTATVDTSLIGNATYGTARPDICAATKYPGRPGCPNVGWSIRFDSSRLTSGTHTLYMTATDATGLTRTVGQTFLIASGGNSTGGAGKCAGRATTDRSPNNNYEIHYIYAIPADATAAEDHCMDTGTAIQRSVAAQNIWLSHQPPSGGKQLNVDTIVGSSRPDVSFIRLNQTKAFYANVAARGQTGAFDQIIGDVFNHFNSPTKRYVVYFDGDIAASGACGLTNTTYSGTVPSSGANDDHIKWAISVVPLGNVIGNSCSTGGITNSTSSMGRADYKFLHETLHALGAVPSCGVNSTGSHVSDTNDIMNAKLSPNSASIKLDIGGDSYFGGNVKASCFNIRTDSKFVH